MERSLSRKTAAADKPFPHEPTPFWVRYLFAVAVSVFAWAFYAWLGQFFAQRMTPFLAGFAAVVVAAAWAGFGPGILATALVTAWSAWSLTTDLQETPAGIVARCAIFAGEGILLSFGSARLRRASREAARGERWHRNLVETAGEAIWVVDAEGVIMYANPRAAEILGEDVADLKGRSQEDFFFREDLSVERIRFHSRRPGVKAQFDRRLRRSDGGEVWVLTCSNTILDSWTGSPGILSMMTDITERKRAEEALRRSEQRFRGLFDNVLEGVYQSTPDGRVLAANPMLLRMLGMTNEAELNDVNIARDLYVDPGVRKRLLVRLEQDGSLQQVEYELRRRDGRVITVQENARVVRDDEGKPLYYEGTLTDITERKQIEAQLRQAQKMEALGRLAGGIAHDFSNIVTVISGYAQLTLGELAESHPARRHAEQVIKAAGSASGLTRQLLSFGRRNPLVPVALDLNRIVRGFQRALETALGDIRLLLTLPEDRVPVSADQGHIEQMVLNLALNARDSMPEGGILEVHVEVLSIDSAFRRHWPETRPGQYAVTSVRSVSGRSRGGHDPEDTVRGVGMSTTQSIVSQYGGFVVADVHPGGGWIFSIYLPLADDSDAAERISDAGFVESARREAILLVDDEPLVRELSRDLLERQGYEVTLAEDPLHAERAFRAGGFFDLLVTDIVMPQMSGPELARKLRASQPGLKVLFISGYASHEMDRDGVECADTVLQKPFSAETMGRKVREILDRA